MAQYRNKYNRESYRLKNWDYRNPGIYFITICTKDRIHHFGDCTNGQMIWNAYGKIATNFWKEIPMHFQHVKLDEFIIMPNHVHGILILGDMGYRDDADCFIVGPLHCNGPTIKPFKNNKMSAISPKSGSVSTIIRSYKSVCTKHIRLLNPRINFQWQSRFYDRILWNQKEVEIVRKYILNNPRNCDKDSLR